jgi:hypothetical protein
MTLEQILLSNFGKISKIGSIYYKMTNKTAYFRLFLILVSEHCSNFYVYLIMSRMTLEDRFFLEKY